MSREIKQKIDHIVKVEAPTIHYFKKIHDYVEKQGNAQLKEIGLTLAQGHMLGFLKHCEGYRAPLKEIENHMRIAQSTTAGMASRLESNGFVRIIPDSHDKRIKIVELTDRGAASIEEVKKSMRKIDEQLFSDLTEEELETLKVILEKVRNSCNRENDNNRRMLCQE